MKPVAVLAFLVACSSASSKSTGDDDPPNKDAPTVEIDAPEVQEDAPEVFEDAPVDSPPTTGGLHIQDIQDGTLAQGSAATLTKVFVTGVRISTGGTVNLYVQEAQGVTTAGHTYPEYAGMNVFFTKDEALLYPDLSTLAAGDCITVSGTAQQFPTNPTTDVGTDELATITAFAKATGCGTAPTPVTLDFADIATDTDTSSATVNTPGPKAEIYEGVLVTIATGTKGPATAVTTNRFSVTPTADATMNLEVDAFLIGGTFSYPANQAFTSLTGVYSQVNRGTGQSLVVYRLTPRTTAELAQ